MKPITNIKRTTLLLVGKIVSIAVLSLAIPVAFAYADTWWESSGSNIYKTNSGNVGIGSTSPSARLSVEGMSWLNGNTMLGNPINNVDGSVLPQDPNIMLTLGTTTSLTGIKRAIMATIVNASANTAPVRGLDIFVTHGPNATADLTSSLGGLSNMYTVKNASIGRTVGLQYGVVSLVDVSGNNAVSTHTGAFRAQTPTVTSGNTITNYAGLFVQGGSVSGTLTNRYGLYIENLLGGTNRYGVYQAGASDPNYFAGNVGIGTTTPAERLDVNGNIKLTGSIVSDGDICIGTCE